MKRFSLFSLFLGAFFLAAFSGCAVKPKYIPSEYFKEKHAMNLSVLSFPTPTHSEDETGGGLIEAAVGASVKSSRQKELTAIFKNIDAEAARKKLEARIGEKIKDYYLPATDKSDLAFEVSIKRWGWILPTSSYGIRIGSYELEIIGHVRVYDISQGKKEIAYSYITTQEIIHDKSSVEENQRAVNKALDEFAELCSEFLWRSDADAK